MARGGARNGAGRKKGSKSRVNAEAAARLDELDCDPLANLVAITKDERASLDLKAKVNIELVNLKHPKPRPEPQRRAIRIEGRTIEEKAMGLLDAMGDGQLSPEETNALLQGLGRIVEIQRFGDYSNVLAELAARAGIAAGAELELRRKIPAALNHGPNA